MTKKLFIAAAIAKLTVSPAFAHGAHIHEMSGHSHLVAIGAGFAVLALIGGIIVARNAKKSG